MKNLTQCVHLLDLFAFVANAQELVVFIGAVAASAAAAFALKAARSAIYIHFTTWLLRIAFR